MKRTLIIILLTALLFPVQAQKRRTKSAAKTKKQAPTALEQARTALEVYDFESAADILSKEIESLTRKKLSTAEADSLLFIAQNGTSRLLATEKIIIIDSVVCSKDMALKAIRLSNGNGHLHTYASIYMQQDTQGATLYENDFGNKRFLAVPSKGNTSPILSVSDKIGNDWTAPTPIKGLHASDIAQNFPFLLSDGVTLFFAAKGPESMGGYDIFVTRADDSNDNSYLTPENLGFPFNSAANDYLMVIDEQAKLGWFISDRRQPEGKVCVYTFIPNERRNNYTESTDPQILRNAARISRIRDTWKDMDAVKAAQQRLSDLRTGKTIHRTNVPDFCFPIDDNRTYTRIADFKSEKARVQMTRWLNLEKTNKSDEVILQRLRERFAETTNDVQREKLAQSILRLENSYSRNVKQTRSLAKEIRNIEITNSK
ncbi:MAG: hypothetical protein K6F94_02170 [Bacteroidaceae bacterium]|nr:hypothetical protein [Bacteroidaceae bacterium]